MDTFLSGGEIISSLNIMPFQLLELVERGLEPHDKETGRPIMIVSEAQKLLGSFKYELEELGGSPRQLSRLRTVLRKPSLREQLAHPKFNSSIDEHETLSLEQKMLDCRERISELEAKGIFLPKMDNWKWSTCIVLKRSKDTYDRLYDFLYSRTKLWELLGTLPDSCPHNEQCFSIIQQRLVSDSQFNQTGANVEGTFSPNKFVLPYFDEDDTFYSSELAIAIRCWEALSRQKPTKGGKTIKAQALKWLATNHSKLSEEAKNRIATLVNPDRSKRGGSPITPGKENLPA